MKIETTDEGLRAVDAAKNTLTVRTEGWTPGGSAPSLHDALGAVGLEDTRTPDVVLSGVVDLLGFPPVYAPIREVDTGEVFELGAGTGPLSIPDGAYVLHIGSSVHAYVRFDGPATVEKPDYERFHVRFPESTAVSIGFSTGIQNDTEVVTVPRTPAGVAEALSAFPAGHRTATADRSFATMRGRPPRVDFGETLSVPPAVRDRTEDADARLVVPPDLEYLFPVAPLAHYVGARVDVEPGATPRVETPGGVDELPAFPEFQDAVGELLERTFYLDCVVRESGPYASDLGLASVLEEVGVDADALYAAPPAERFDAYRAVPFERVADRFPDWHLSMSIAPRYEHVPTLSHLLANVPHVRIAESASLAETEWLDNSLDDFYRADAGPARAAPGDVASVELVQPELGPGRTHGWLADGVPIDAFKTLPEAYENRTRYLDAAGEPTSVVAILNDGEMRDEHAEVAALYRRRAEALDLDVSLRENLAVDELATVFESRHDLVHYIGHCEREGLRCADGYLSASSLAESNAQTFFLNACGSYHEGIELVRKGSVAGGVTFNEVLDSQAATVGTMFARLMVNGFSIERALDKSRRRIMTGKDYAVVGDGTHVLTQSEDFVGADIQVDNLGDDRYRVRYFMDAPWITGGAFRSYLQETNETHLLGETLEFTIDRARLLEYMAVADTAVLYDGDLHWSDTLEEKLGRE